MKFVRFGSPGKEKPGLIDAQGELRDLSRHTRHLDLQHIRSDGLRSLQSIDVHTLPKVAGRPRLGVPFTGISKFIGIGLNYVDHAAEAGMRVPKEPIIFLKATTCITGPNDAIELPPNSLKTDWEVELGVVIGQTARRVDEADALAHVAGYCVVNDVSERAWQTERGGTWDKGKGFDSFGPIGPWLVTPDEVPNPQGLALWLDVNGQPKQRGNTASMVFTVAQLVSYVSQCMTLLPGDVIATGTPPGVGMGIKPTPQFLKAGDIVELGIDGLGRQRQIVSD